MAPQKRRVLVVGGGFSGLLVARDLAKQFSVTVVDAKEYFEYTPGILRVYVHPSHYDALSFTLPHVVERKLGCKFLFGEVKKIDEKAKTATVKTMYNQCEEQVEFDYCVIAAGCNFNPMHKFGESLWFPTVQECARQESAWKHIDERFYEGRRRHMLEEHQRLAGLNAKGATILIAGAGFIGVEWATELQHYFPKLKLTVIDFLPKCLGPLPDSAAQYCVRYMDKVGIKQFYGIKYEPTNQAFWDKIELPNRADDIFVCMGVKATNWFMPAETLSDKGPGGGGWIHMNHQLQVTTKQGQVWGDGTCFAVGDCNYGCIGNPPNFELQPIPKISYPGEEQALHAVKNIRALDAAKYGSGGCCATKKMMKTWWPWGAGMFATSLGPNDACFVVAANHQKGSGYMVLWGILSAIQKALIESTKTDECKGGLIGEWIWHFVHHTPVHLWGAGKGFC